MGIQLLTNTSVLHIVNDLYYNLRARMSFYENFIIFIYL